MATITKRLDQFHFPDLCVNCQAPAEIAYPLVTQTGIDMISFRYVTYVTLPIPVCAECMARRTRIGWIALACVAAIVAASILLIIYGPRDRQGEIESYVVVTGICGILGAVWYWRNWLRRDLDKAILGVRGKKFKQATNELTLWFREEDNPQEALASARFVADPVAQKSERLAVSGFAAQAQQAIQQREAALAQHRGEVLSQLESDEYRLQVNHRPFIIAGAICTFLLAWYIYSMSLEDAVPRRRGERDVFPLSPILAFAGAALLGFGGITIEVNSGQILRSFWGLKKRLDRRTTTVKSYTVNSYTLHDDYGKSLTISNQLQNHDRLLAECQLRTDELT
jgi:hypothetical protein